MAATLARASAPVVDTSASPRARLHPLPLDAFTLDEGFWAPRLRLLRDVTLRQQYEQCERTGRIDHFRRASGRKAIPEFVGKYYDDSDVYKWLEAASYSLGTEPDSELERLVDAVVDEIAAAQEPDGYLNTYFTFERAPERWSDLARMHQLYCAGHLIQAAVAHHRATGSRALLDVATRFADLICDTFTPANPGTDGHEEIELALVELYRATGNRRYLEQAAFFLDQRGQQPPVLDGSIYLQDHLPVRRQHDIVGHAVRATYLAIAMADVYAETNTGTEGDETLWTAVQALWRSAFERKAYVIGGLGAHWQGEAFGADYELPNERAYAETCAAIGGFYWNWRMLLLTGEARYADWMETALHNGILSGISLDGTAYFYQNPLADGGAHRRQPWFGTACCPPNIARLLLSLPGFIASTSHDGRATPGPAGPAGPDGATTRPGLFSGTGGSLWLHHYVPGDLRIRGPRGGGALRVDTAYPWDGHVRLTVTEHDAGPMEATLRLRIPHWCAAPALRVNGHLHEGHLESGSYAAVRRTWRVGDVVELDLPMAVRRLRSHPRVLSNLGRVALARGPLVYCLEAIDHPGADLRDLSLAPDAPLTAEHRPDLLGGVTVLRGTAAMATPAGHAPLYSESPAPTAEPYTLPLTAVPYHAWANREPGQMAVWLRQTP
jgi:uncharacterized protein